MIAGQRVQKWLLGAVLGAFGAGALAGLAAPRAVASLAGTTPETADEFYVRELATRYGLDRHQVELIRMVLAARTADYLRVLLGDQGRLPPELRFEVTEADRRAQERIKTVLTEEQRRRFLRDSTPEEFAPEQTGDPVRAKRR